MSMPYCLKCDDHFPNRLLIEGKRRNLSKRKYCLACSPFGSGNTRPLHKRVLDASGKETLECKICSRIYEYNSSSRKGHTRDKCNSCSVNIRRFKLKVKAVEYKGGACGRCGYSKCLRSLSFHHRDPSTKSFTVGGNHCRSWEVIRVELDKCDILCSNCHNEVHELEDSARRSTYH